MALGKSKSFINKSKSSKSLSPGARQEAETTIQPSKSIFLNKKKTFLMTLRGADDDRYDLGTSRAHDTLSSKKESLVSPRSERGAFTEANSPAANVSPVASPKRQQKLVRAKSARLSSMVGKGVFAKLGKPSVNPEETHKAANRTQLKDTQQPPQRKIEPVVINVEQLASLNDGKATAGDEQPATTRNGFQDKTEAAPVSANTKKKATLEDGKSARQQGTEATVEGEGEQETVRPKTVNPKTVKPKTKKNKLPANGVQTKPSPAEGTVAAGAESERTKPKTKKKTSPSGGVQTEPDVAEATLAAGADGEPAKPETKKKSSSSGGVKTDPDLTEATTTIAAGAGEEPTRPQSTTKKKKENSTCDAQPGAEEATGPPGEGTGDREISKPKKKKKKKKKTATGKGGIGAARWQSKSMLMFGHEAPTAAELAQYTFDEEEEEDESEEELTYSQRILAGIEEQGTPEQESSDRLRPETTRRLQRQPRSVRGQSSKQATIDPPPQRVKWTKVVNLSSAENFDVAETLEWEITAKEQQAESADDVQRAMRFNAARRNMESWFDAEIAKVEGLEDEDEDGMLGFQKLVNGNQRQREEMEDDG